MPKIRTTNKAAKAAAAKAAAAAKPAAPAATAAAADTPTRKRKINWDAVVARARQRPAAPEAPPEDMFKTRAPFRLPDHPPGAVPEGAPKLAMDDALTETCAWATTSWATSPGAFAFEEGLTFLGYAYLSLLAQRPEYRVISETIATEMTRKWIKIKAKGDSANGDDKADKIQQISDRLDELKTKDRCRELTEQDGFFGRSHLYLDTGDSDDPQELLTPIGDGRNSISVGKISKKHPLQRLATIEAVWTYPTSYNSNDPLRPDWYKPASWFVMQKQIHSSRLLTFVGREVPDLLKPTYSFGGLSLSQMAKPYVDNWLRTRQSVADLIHSFSVFALSGDLQASLQGDGDDFFRRLDLFNALRDNRGVMALNKDTELLENISAPLGTLDALQAQTQEHMAAVSRIPLVKLLGITPDGLNATSEGELRTFYDTIASYQERFLREPLTRIIGFVQLSLFDEVDPDIIFEFEPLWALDEKTRADIRKVDAETGQILIDDGTLHPAEERARVANDPETLYPGLDIDDVPEPPPDPMDGDPDGLDPDRDDTDDDSSGKEDADRVDAAADEAADEAALSRVVTRDRKRRSKLK